jgi:hypothetical protein
VIFVLIDVICTEKGTNEDWLSFEKGDILYTDGVPVKSEYKQLNPGLGLNIDIRPLSEKCPDKDGYFWDGFQATDSGGKCGCTCCEIFQWNVLSNSFLFISLITLSSLVVRLGKYSNYILT